eukprot:SAG11_NODE_262_length_11529_cov_12.277603_11_plen_84_part_00
MLDDGEYERARGKRDVEQCPSEFRGACLIEPECSRARIHVKVAVDIVAEAEKAERLVLHRAQTNSEEKQERKRRENELQGETS